MMVLTQDEQIQKTNTYELLQSKKGDYAAKHEEIKRKLMQDN